MASSSQTGAGCSAKLVPCGLTGPATQTLHAQIQRLYLAWPVHVPSQQRGRHIVKPFGTFSLLPQEHSPHNPLARTTIVKLAEPSLK